MIAGVASLCGAACAAENDGTQTLQTSESKDGRVYLSLADLPVACRAVETVPGEAPSLLPEGRGLKLVWHDEFGGDALDASKWSYRTNFWGQSAHWFATPADNAVEVKDGLLRLKLVKRPDGQFVSPQLQTGELLWDIPHDANPKGPWPLGKREKPKFVKKYGYFECRARLQQLPGWWSAFWMQSESQGVTLDPGVSGIEHDIMESFAPGEVVPSWFHMNGYGADYQGFCIPDVPKNDDATLKLDVTQFHVFGMLWTPEGYEIYVDGRLRGKSAKAVSHVPEFVLLTTEAKWYRVRRMTGKVVPELEAAAAAGDDFVVDYVRVYDLADCPPPTNAVTVQDAPGYNAWPMIQAFGDRVVCTYSRDSARPAGGSDAVPADPDELRGGAVRHAADGVRGRLRRGAAPVHRHRLGGRHPRLVARLANPLPLRTPARPLTRRQGFAISLCDPCARKTSFVKKCNFVKMRH